MTTTMVAALLAAVPLAGCGSSNDNGGGGGVNPAAAPSVNNAVDKCLKQAKEVQEQDARKTAEEACKAAKSGDTGKVKNAVKEECLNAVKQIPDSETAQKKAAEERCKAIK